MCVVLVKLNFIFLNYLNHSQYLIFKFLDVYVKKFINFRTLYIHYLFSCGILIFIFSYLKKCHLNIIMN